MQIHDPHDFKGGLNADDSPNKLPQGDYTDAINLRTNGSDEEHGEGNAETLQSEIPVLINPATAITYYGQAIGGEFQYSGYGSVQIGLQTWMKKNFDGDYPGSKVYDDDEDNRAVYGGLYTHDMIMESDFCPKGWHVPTEAEYDVLLAYLGGLMLAGGNMKEVGESHWTPPNTGAEDIGGFRALPAGKFDEVFDLLGLNGLLWIADDAAPLAPTALPASNVHPFTFDANWQAQDGATGYKLDVSTDATFSSMVSGYDDLDVGNVLTLTVSGLTIVTNYYYRLRVYNEVGESDDSNTIYLQTTNTGIPSYGPLYNWYAVDTGILAPAGSHVPTLTEFQDLISAVGGYSYGGNSLKCIGEDFWLTANGNDTYGFNAKGAGIRQLASGIFQYIKERAWFWSSTEDTAVHHMNLSDDTSGIGLEGDTGDVGKVYGCSVRCIKDSTSLSIGQTSTVTDIDGNIYPTKCMPDGKEWMTENLKVTHYNDGTPIPEITNDAEWAALITGAMCWYNNIPDIPTPPVTDDDMKYLQTKDLGAGVITDVTTPLTSTQEPYNVFVLDTDGNDITSLVGISIELIGGVWVIHIDTIIEYLGAKIKIIY